MQPRAGKQALPDGFLQPEVGTGGVWGSSGASVSGYGTVQSARLRRTADKDVYPDDDGEVACYATNGDAVWLQKFEGMGFGSVTLGLPGNVRQGDDVGSK